MIKVNGNEFLGWKNMSKIPFKAEKCSDGIEVIMNVHDFGEIGPHFRKTDIGFY
jgi:hypothetical protein